MTTPTEKEEIVRALQAGKQPRVRMSEEEFAAWADEDVRAEWVDGNVLFMLPSKYEHADLVTWLTTLLRHYVDARDLGSVLSNKFPFRMTSQRRHRLPDVLFIAKSRRNAIKATYVDAAPDLIIEVVSSATEDYDYREKYFEYEAAGVREYWIVDPMKKRMEAYALSPSNRYAPILPVDGKTKSTAVEGWFLKSWWLWLGKRPSAYALTKEFGLV